MSTIWCAMCSVFICTPSQIMEMSSRSGMSANSAAANSRSRPVRFGSVAGSNSLTLPGPPRRSQRRPRARGLIASSPKAIGCGRPCAGPPLRCHSRHAASHARISSSAQPSTMSRTSCGQKPSSGGVWLFGAGRGSVGKMTAVWRKGLSAASAGGAGGARGSSSAGSVAPGVVSTRGASAWANSACPSLSPVPVVRTDSRIFWNSVAAFAAASSLASRPMVAVACSAAELLALASGRTPHRRKCGVSPVGCMYESTLAIAAAHAR